MRWPLPGSLVLALALLAVPANAGGASVPDQLPADTRALADGLDELAGAEDLAAMRDTHANLTPVAERVLGHAEDLAGREGALLETYLDRLAEQLDAGNRSDAESLARAAATTTRQEVVPAAEAWATNRTAILAGSASWTDEGLSVPIVLANPPPAGVGAVDVEVEIGDEAAPRSASLALGQGETSVDAANGTARLASFDAAALANLDRSTQRATLGTVVLEPDGLDPGNTVDVEVTPREAATPEGRSTPVIGLAAAVEVPEEAGGLFNTRLLALAGVGAGAALLFGLSRRLEV